MCVFSILHLKNISCELFLFYSSAYTLHSSMKTKLICYNLVEENVVLNYCIYLSQTRFAKILKHRNIKKIVMITGGIIAGHSA